MSTNYSESRDGPRHSDKIDDCNDPAVKPLVDSATLATRALFFAFRDYLAASSGDEAAREAASEQINRVIFDSTSFRDGCGFENNYCETPWADLAKEAETVPLLGCSNTQPTTWLIILLGLGMLRWTLHRRGLRGIIKTPKPH